MIEEKTQIIDNFNLPADAKPGPNCGVTAIAASTGQSFARVWNLCAKHLKHRKRMTGSTVHIQRLKVLDELGADYEVVPHERMTLQAFCQRVARPRTTYMVTTTGHVQLVRIIEGVAYVLDQCGCKAIDEYSGRRKFIYRPTLRMGPPPLGVPPWGAPEPTQIKPIQATMPPQRHTSLFPSLFPEQSPAQAPTQLSLF